MSKRLMSLIFIALVIVFVNSTKGELVGHWRFDEGTGDSANDSSGNGNHGTLIDSVEWDVGKIDGAVKFDGTPGYVLIPHSDSLKLINQGDFTITMWFRQDVVSGIANLLQQTDSNGTGRTLLLADATDGIRAYLGGTSTLSGVIQETGVWYHVAMVVTEGGDADTIVFYINGEQSGTPAQVNSEDTEGDYLIGTNKGLNGRWINGLVDDFRLYNHALSPPEILAVMEGAASYPYAIGPDPADGALIEDTWVNLSWSPGDLAVSHDIYIGDDFDDVNEGVEGTFIANQTDTFIVVGFPGFPIPDGLVPGTTYYWRIDEVNNTEPNSPWKGDIWRFSIPPKTAYSPEPADADEFIDINVILNWTPGYGAKLHYIVFGEDYDEVNNTIQGTPNGAATYSPGPLKLANTYYWRVDEFDGVETYRGNIWSFTTIGAVSGPNPADGETDVKPSIILSWDAGAVAASHEVYFGTDADTVANATMVSPEYKGPKALDEESYDPGKLTLSTTYYWRIDEVNDSPDSPWVGNIWSFTTGNYFVIDDFEDYNADENQIWFSWHDGLGYGTPGTPDFFGGNGTGAAVGDENTLSYTEETIVHGGNQSMPVTYDNNKQGFSKYSEVELTLIDQRDWTEEGVTELSIWFRGNPASVGSFVEASAGTYTMTATGADIWNQADQFHFAYKMLSGAGSIVARVESVQQTDVWAKAGVMIRETLDAGSKFAAVYITPTAADETATNGCRFQARTDTDVSATSDTSVATAEQTAIIAPYWVKLERDVGGNFRGYYSANGTAWTPMSWNPQFITMSSTVYVGLALTSHNNSATCEAKFSDVTITGNATGQWTNQDIGIVSNDPEPLYVAVSNRAGVPAVVIHDNPDAATIDTWTEWVIPLQVFIDLGVVLTDVDKIAIGLGTQGNMTVPGGKGKMYIDDIRLYQLRSAP